MSDAGSALARRAPAEMSEAELVVFAEAEGVRWFGFWPLPLPRVEHRWIWRRRYPEERAFMARYFPAWFVEQEFSIRNAILTRRSRNFYRNNIVMAPDKFANQGYFGGLSPIADRPTFAHELLHALDRQVGGAPRIWSSYVERQLPDRATGRIDENAYYEYDASLTRADEMFEQFRGLNPEAQGECFEEGVRRSEAALAGSGAARAEAEDQVDPYREILGFVRSLPVGERLRLR